MNNQIPASVRALRKEALRRAGEIRSITVSAVCLDRWGVCFRVVVVPGLTVMWYPGSESWTGSTGRHKGTFDQFLGWIRQQKQAAADDDFEVIE